MNNQIENSELLEQGVNEMNNKNNYLTNSPLKEQVTIQTGDLFPNAKNIAGNSVDKHKELESANAIISGDEIKQQNENL
jgi:hypothetical protein